MDWMAHPTIHAAAVAGRTSAIAAEGQRDMARCASQAPELFPPKPFDATLFGTVSACNAFSAAPLPATALRTINRSALWGFALDWQIDYLAKTAEQVDNIVSSCQAVGAGQPATDGLTGFLAELRRSIVEAPACARDGGEALVAAWAHELGRMLGGMRREWQWRAAQARPTLDEYLDNADNIGAAFCSLAHWIATTDDAQPDHLPVVLAAVRAEQKALRLINDQGTFDRDLEWGDLNALLLASRDDVADRLAQLVALTEESLVPLEPVAPQLATFLLRQIGFCTAFWGVTDYWGQL